VSQAGNQVTVQAKPEPLEIDLSRTAVIVVDMQNAFVSRGGYWELAGWDISAVQKIIRPCREIVSAARQKGIKVICLQMVCRPDLADIGSPDSPNRRKSKGLALLHQRPELRDKLYICGSWGADIIEELAPEPGDIVIQKPKYDGFIGTNLDIVLRTCGLKYLIFVGTATNICVESTLRHAFFLEYFPILVTDAVSQLGPGKTQEATIFNVQSFLGWVTTSDKLLNAITLTEKP
jgi:ureidoacrylate peracid hydrolase